jgi:hypothetical protein
MSISSNPAPNKFVNTSSILNGNDITILSNVEASLQRSLQIRQWWQQKKTTGGFAEEFNLIRSFNHPARATGFFDAAVVNGEYLPVMGVVQEMMYDRADTGAKRVSATICRELREFVLHYFMRVSDFRQPEAAIQPENGGSYPEQSMLSWCSRNDPHWTGFGYSQLYYKLLDSKKIGKFPESDQYAIVDLRQLGSIYEWIVAKVRIFDFDLHFRPFGSSSPSLSIPLSNITYLVLNQAFVSDATDEQAGTGEYGFGYGLLHLNDDNSFLAYGPGHFGSGFQTITFRLTSGGEICVRTVFVVNRPQRILNVPLDPLRWGMGLINLGTMGMAGQIFSGFNMLLNTITGPVPSFDPLLTYIWLVNRLTGGVAAGQLCISKEQLEKEMLVQHFMEHYNMITGSLLTWRQIPDWLDAAALPPWVIHGTNI